MFEEAWVKRVNEERVAQLERARYEALRFVERVEKVLGEAKVGIDISCWNRSMAAVKRSSMDLSMVLVPLRKPTR